MARATLLAALLLIAGSASGEPATGPTISLVIDDLGNNRHEAERVIQLPGSVVCAVLPHTRHAAAIAETAHAHGKPVILHLPMEPMADIDPGPGQIDSHMSLAQMQNTLESDLASVPHAAGVSNHMGSLMTAQPVPMRWLMRALTRRHLYFIDSRTESGSLAAIIARQEGVPVLERQVFLDPDPSPATVARQLERLEQLARRQGHALAIGHPYPATLAALEHWLPTLATKGLKLIPPDSRMALVQREEQP
jgi:polysaccharide deacetylase 2 family uncharacterized protein YibQ